MRFPSDAKFSRENVTAMFEAMDRINNNKEMSDERKEQMMDATFRLYMGEPTEREIELRRAYWAEKDEDKEKDKDEDKDN